MFDSLPLKRTFAYKAHADAALLDAVSHMAPDAPGTEIALRTLGHMLIVDRIFIAHMNGASHGYASANAVDAPDLGRLAAELRASDRALVDYVTGVDERSLVESVDFAFTDGDPGRMSRQEMLMHLAIHGGYHRGQVGWMLTLEGLVPPPDGLANYLHHAEPFDRRRALATPLVPASARQAPLPRMSPVAPQGSDAESVPARFQSLTTRLRSSVANGLRIGKSVKFDLKEAGCILIVGDSVSNENRPADLTLTISIDDLRAIGQGKLSAMGAVTKGRLKLSDMGLALSLQKKLRDLFAMSH